VRISIPLLSRPARLLVLCGALLVGLGAGSSTLSSEDPLSLPPVRRKTPTRITSFAKKFFPSIGTIMICSLSDSFSATIFWISMGF